MSMRLAAIIVLSVCVNTVFPQPDNEFADLEYIHKGVEGSEYKQFGKFVIRMKAANGSGVAASFGLLPDIDYGVNAGCDIDVLGKDGNEMQASFYIISAEPYYRRPYLHSSHFHSEPFHAEYYTYTLEWKPESVTLLVDSVTCRLCELTEDSLVRDRCWNIGTRELTRDTTYDDNWISVMAANRLRFTAGVWYGEHAESWLGKWDDASCGTSAFISYFEYYRYLAEEDGDEEFELADMDRFDGTTFDPQHWKATDMVIRDGTAIGTLNCYGKTGYDSPVPIDKSGMLAHKNQIVKTCENNVPLSIAGNTVTYTIREPGRIKLTVHDMCGRHVCTPVDLYHSPGTYTHSLSIALVPSGTYIVNLVASSTSNSIKMIRLNSRYGYEG